MGREEPLEGHSEAVDATFAGAVGEGAAAGGDTGNRADEEDNAAAAFFDQGDGVFGGDEGAFEIDVDDLIPVKLFEVFHLHVGSAEDAGAGDEDVEAAEFRLRTDGDEIARGIG